MVNFVLVIWILVVNFWVWNLIGLLLISYVCDMLLFSVEVLLFVVILILVGVFGCIVIGLFIDCFGGCVMFIVVMLMLIFLVFVVGVVVIMGFYVLLVFFGFFLGVVGMIFVVGILFVNNWY